VMSEMKDLVDERTRRGRLKIDQKYRNNHSGLHARRHLNVAFFCETTTFISSALIFLLLIENTNTKQLSLALSLSAPIDYYRRSSRGYALSSYSKSRTISRGISPFGGG
jgi:hypothetical protein